MSLNIPRMSPLSGLDDIDGATRDHPLTGIPDCQKRKKCKSISFTMK
jgi:hypothetical protein